MQNTPQHDDKVLYAMENAVATITLNDPQTLNALGSQLKDKMLEALTRADKDDNVRVIILKGSQGHFSSGGNIKEMLEDGLEQDALANKLEQMVSGVGETIRKIRAIHKPIIAQLEGAVAGAGMNVALACDFRIAGNNAKFIQSFIDIGLIPDGAGMYQLTQLIGAAKTTELVMLGDKITAEQALSLNLINDMVTLEQLEEHVQMLAKRLSNKPRQALASIKQMINRHAYGDLYEVLEVEVQQQTLMSRTPDFREGVTAFVEKRVPNYR